MCLASSEALYVSVIISVADVSVIALALWNWETHGGVGGYDLTKVAQWEREPGFQLQKFICLTAV